ncbi:hypothetical protein [Lysobacter olei]
MTVQTPRLALAVALLVASASALSAEPPVTEVAPIRAAALLTFQCEARVLPKQRDVGEALGQYNFSQIYASRARLMSEVGRACQRSGVERVDVVMQPMASPQRDARYLALQAAPAR